MAMKKKSEVQTKKKVAPKKVAAKKANEVEEIEELEEEEVEETEEEVEEPEEEVEETEEEVEEEEVAEEEYEEDSEYEEEDDEDVEDEEGVSEKALKNFAKKCEDIFEQISRDIVGQKEVVYGTVIAMIAGGNVLLEGVPGVGKTRLIRSLGRVFDLPFSRIQFTPDLMPADVTGTNIIVRDEKGNSKFSFQPGPIFSNIVLADEINRATPKTQSALLEAMAEHSVTVMGETRKLEEPFFVLATQNPIEQDGTYPLPEAQMDRFMFKLIMEYPTMEELKDIVNMTQATMAEVADAACSAEELLKMRETAKHILVSDSVLEYAMKLIVATQPESDAPAKITTQYVRTGASPRAAQALITTAKVRALVNGRYNVSKNDINALACMVLRHRLKLNFEAITNRVSGDDVVKEIIRELSGEKNQSSLRSEAQPKKVKRFGKKHKEEE